MKFSFYRNITWVIGILVAAEALLKLGLHRSVILLVADLIVVLILTFLFHRLRISNNYAKSVSQMDTEDSADDQQAEMAWQKKHDQWWQSHRQMRATNFTSNPTAPNNVDRLERSNRELKVRINDLSRKVKVLRNNSGDHESSYRNSDWYRQIIRLKRQIAQLKSEYR